MPGSSNDTITENSQAKRPFHFKYKDTIYDATPYLEQHPGGSIFFEYFQDQKDDITEYFRSLHSKRALKILQQFKVVGKAPESIDSKKYNVIKNKVKHLFTPNLAIECGLFLVTLASLLWGSFTTHWWLAIPLLWFTQTFSGWVGHSMNHNRDPLVYKIGQVYAPLIAGISCKWWNKKHNLHHMFTNNLKKDTDIQHEYKRYLFQFLFLKWNYDCIVTEYKHKTFILVMLHWVIILNQNIFIVLAAQMLSGFGAAIILVGNHQRETTFKQRVDLPFMEHQLVASRNYYWTDFFSMIYMGGMQYQSEHHLFPQIPFYYLPTASKIINQELKKINLAVQYGDIM